MPSSPPRKGRHRLVRQLRAAYESVGSWDESLRQATQAAGAGGSRAISANASALLAIVQNTKKALILRLAELGVEELPANSAPPFPTDSRVDGESMYLAACQACGRALGAAFREAQAAADSASASVLYGSLRDFEKQLWLLDPCQAD